MPRYKLTLEYDGTPFQGWQVQDGFDTVQGRLRQAVKDFCGDDVLPQGAGRTDAGVHASGQVAHIDLAKTWPPATVRDALNAHLRGQPVIVCDAQAVADDFDARFSAIHRVYRYVILNRAAPPALEVNRVWHVIKPLDAACMQAAADLLLGHHDFTTFRNVNCQARSPFKTLDVFKITRAGDHVVIDAEARSFLHNQVRSMVGSIKCVGDGSKPATWIATILAARDRVQCGAVAPACGLTLTRVDYAK